VKKMKKSASFALICLCLLILAGVYAVITFSKGDKRFKELTGQ